MSVQELKQRLDAGDPPQRLLDVREPWEVQLCALPDITHIPMGAVPACLNELDPDEEIVVVCHHGVRSYQVAYWLQAQGFTNVINLQGGVDAWAKNIDSQMATY